VPSAPTVVEKAVKHVTDVIYSTSDRPVISLYHIHLLFFSKTDPIGYRPSESLDILTTGLTLLSVPQHAN